MLRLASICPDDLNCNCVSIGKSHENRDIRMLEVSQYLQYNIVIVFTIEYIYFPIKTMENSN